MLVLTRKIGERIRIGDGIEVMVTRINGNRVVLGITAPDDIRIVRKELQPQEPSPAPEYYALEVATAGGDW